MSARGQVLRDPGLRAAHDQELRVAALQQQQQQQPVTFQDEIQLDEMDVVREEGSEEQGQEWRCVRGPKLCLQ